MNKFFILCICCITMLCSCNNTGHDKRYPKHIEGEQLGVSITELSINGDTCEYIVYYRGSSIGMDHWTKCKYCNKNHQNKIDVITSDGVNISIYYTGDELSIDTKNEIRKYFHNYTIGDVNAEDFEDNFYNTFNIKNCKFDYNITH